MRRQRGKRGGFAILVRDGLHVLRTHANEFAQLVDLQLHDGSRLAIVNVYMPPVASLRRKHLTDEHA